MGTARRSMPARLLGDDPDADLALIRIVPALTLPAARLGLLVGDILVKIEDEPVAGVDDLVRLLSDEMVGRPTVLTLLRGVELKQLSVIPAERNPG